MANQFQPSLHNIKVIYGAEAVRAFLGEELPLETLSEIGAVKSYSFLSLEEMNAFILGLNEAEGFLQLEIISDDYCNTPLPDPGHIF